MFFTRANNLVIFKKNVVNVAHKQSGKQDYCECKWTVAPSQMIILFDNRVHKKYQNIQIIRGNKVYKKC